MFADTTGDGTVGYLAVADFRMGRESKAETGEPDAPEKADMLVMGSSVQWYAEKTNGKADFPSKPWMLKSFNDENSSPHLRGDWKKHPRQRYNGGSSLDPDIKKKYEKNMEGRVE